MTHKKVYHYWVEPVQRTGFPIDQLRREQSWPSGTEDAIKLAASCQEAYNYPTIYTNDPQIQLTGYQEPNRERWESFGWRVVRTRVENV